MITLMMVYDWRWWHDSYWRNNNPIRNIVGTQQGTFATQQASFSEKSSPDCTLIP